MYNVKCKITALCTLYAAHACEHLSSSCAVQEDPDYPGGGAAAPIHAGDFKSYVQFVCLLCAFVGECD